jgi:glucose-6-phosphate dehydrogenase assembly protein OpcA
MSTPTSDALAAPTWLVRKKVPIEKVDAELRTRWLNAGREGKPITRTQTMSIVAVCETPAHASAAHEAVAIASGVHGARTIVVVADDAAEPSITAEISLHPRDGKPSLPGGEEVRLEAHGAARAWIPDTVGKLLAPDVPVYFWWVGDLPDDDALFDQVAPLSQLAIFNSNDMDLRDLDALAAIGERGKKRFALGDFAWHRLRTWQELTARFFDESTCATELSAMSRAAITFCPRDHGERTHDPISNQAALFAGWLAHVLGWKLDAWKTPLDAKAPTALLTRKDGGKLELSFPIVPRQDVPAGAIVAIDLASKSGKFHIARDEQDPYVVCWSGERPGAVVPAQCVRVHPPDIPRILAHILERPIRDPLFEASLRAAAALVSSIAPAAPRAKS